MFKEMSELFLIGISNKLQHA